MEHRIKKITLLNDDQLYGFNKSEAILKYGKECRLTDYAISQGASPEKSDENIFYSPWYLSPKSVFGDVSCVNLNGDRGFCGFYSSHYGIRPVMSYLDINDFKEYTWVGEDGIRRVNIGFYPRNINENNGVIKLSKLYLNKEMNNTEKYYVSDERYINDPIKHFEFEYEGKKYVRVLTNFCSDTQKLSDAQKYNKNEYVWLESSPITWLVDEKQKLLICEESVLSGIGINKDVTFDNSHMSFILNHYFIHDIFRTKVDYLLYDYFGYDYQNILDDYTKYYLLFYIFFTNMYDSIMVDNRDFIIDLFKSDKIPKGIIPFIANHFDWRYFFSKNDYDLILAYKNDVDLELKEHLSKFLKEVEQDVQINIDKYIDSPEYEDGKIILKCNNIDYVNGLSIDGKISYGEYPYCKVNRLESTILNILSMQTELDKTYKTYTESKLFGEDKYDEYIINNRKFIKKGDEWLEVKQIVWTVDKENNCLVFDEIKLNNIKRGLEDFYRDGIVNCGYKDEEKMSDDMKLKEAIKLEGLEKERERKKQLLFNRLTDITFEAQEITSDLFELGYDYIIIFNVPNEYLIHEVDDHFEFNDDVKNRLRFFNLEHINCFNLKVSGIDFRGTNMKIDPQLVYMKDLSYSSFDDCNIVFRSFEGCDLRGTDLSNELESLTIDGALIDENTKLPYSRKRKLM